MRDVKALLVQPSDLGFRQALVDCFQNAEALSHSKSCQVRLKPGQLSLSLPPSLPLSGTSLKLEGVMPARLANRSRTCGPAMKPFFPKARICRSTSVRNSARSCRYCVRIIRRNGPGSNCSSSLQHGWVVEVEHHKRGAEKSSELPAEEVAA